MTRLARFRAELAERLRRIARDRTAAKKLRRLIRRERSKALTISDKGVKFIATFEGYLATPSDVLDGHATVGRGHLIHHGPVTAADRKGVWVPNQQRPGFLTRQEADLLLRMDLERTYVPPVRKLFAKGGPLEGQFKQHRFDALVSFVYNLGVYGLQGGPGFETFGGAIKRGDVGGIANSLPLYVNGPTGKLPGLVRRRNAEKRMFLLGNYSTN